MRNVLNHRLMARQIRGVGLLQDLLEVEHPLPFFGREPFNVDLIHRGGMPYPILLAVISPSA